MESLGADIESHIERVIWTKDQIATRVSALAFQISADLSTLSPPSSVVVVGVANGAFIFLADLIRLINFPIFVDFVRAESYHSGTKSSNQQRRITSDAESYHSGTKSSNQQRRITSDLELDVEGKHVILVEDIVATGSTIACLIAHMKSKGALSVSVCTFLDKPERRQVHFELVGQGKFYSAFECSDYFVVGYGMKFGGLYRNLPYVGILKPEFYQVILNSKY